MFKHIQVFFSRRKVWTCQDGRRIRIKDMDDSHIVNTINMIRRNMRQNLNVISKALMGEDDARDVIHDIWSDRFFGSRIRAELVEKKMRSLHTLIPIYKDLTEEADRRNLVYDKDAA